MSNSGHGPFRRSAEKYRNRGWNNPIPLPEGRKNPPPTGFTGHNGKAVEAEQLKQWLKDNKYEKSNLGVRLDVVSIVDDSGITTYYEIVGLDIDHHPEDEDDPKHGGDQLEWMESQLGKLPDTWISSARNNGIAGIRFFLQKLEVDNKGKPKLLAWRGDCSEHGAPDIDIISRGYRFAVVSPSIHPNGMEYLWYPTGVKPEGPEVLSLIDWSDYGVLTSVSDGGNGSGGSSDGGDVVIPDPAKHFAVLPEKWAKWLTRNYIEDSPMPMDMAISDRALEEWAFKNFALSGLAPGVSLVGNDLTKGGAPKKGDVAEPMCDVMEKALKAQIAKIHASSTSHNILYKGHMNLLKLGSKDGHAGWGKAIKEFEREWQTSVLARQKRNISTLRGEIKRSLFGGLRKVKGVHDLSLANGQKFFLGHDPCVINTKNDDGTPKMPFKVPNLSTDPISYERNDSGNGKHLADMYFGCIRYVFEFGYWIIWDGKRWIRDEKGYVRMLFHAVRAVQAIDGRKMVAEGIRTGNAEKEKEGQKWVAWSVRSGDKTRIDNALFAAQDWVSLNAFELDSDPYLLGVANGIVRFDPNGGNGGNGGNGDDDGDGFELLDEGNADLLVTMNTNIPYIPMAEQKACAARVYGEKIADIDATGGAVRKLPEPRRGDAEEIEMASGYVKFWTFLNLFVRQQYLDETWDYMSKLFGYQILGKADMKKMIVLTGDTDTGKTTFSELYRSAVGEYGTNCDAHIFKRSRFQNELAEALPRRVATVGEIGKSLITADWLKQVLGNEPLSIELKNKNNTFKMVGRASFISTSNSAPNIPEEDQATRNRFLVIEFNHQVTGKNADGTKTADTVNHCRTAMLAWLIEGCSAALKDEGCVHRVPDELQMSTNAYTSDLSDVAAFVTECLGMAQESDWETYRLKTDNLMEVKGRSAWPNEKCVGDGDLWARFKLWQDNNLNSNNRLTRRQFTSALKGQGFKQDGYIGKQRRWVGIWIQNSVKTL